MSNSEYLSRRDFLKLATVGAAEAFLLASCAGRLGDAEHPVGADLYSTALLSDIEAELRFRSNLHPDLTPYANLDWFWKADDIIYGIKQVAADDVGAGEVVAQTTKQAELYFRLYWTSGDAEPFLAKEALPIFEKTLLLHELGHIKLRYQIWEYLKSQGLTGSELTDQFMQQVNMQEFLDIDEPHSEWVEDLYNVALSEDQNLARVISEMYTYDEKEKLFDRLSMVKWLRDNGLSWNSNEYRWLSERSYFTSVQSFNELNKMSGKPETLLPRLTIHDNQLRKEFVDFLLNPDGGGLVYQPGEVKNEVIDGKITLTSRDMFETNPRVEEGFKVEH